MGPLMGGDVVVGIGSREDVWRIASREDGLSVTSC